jgi:hypothetical protein
MWHFLVHILPRTLSSMIMTRQQRWVSTFLRSQAWLAHAMEWVVGGVFIPVSSLSECFNGFSTQTKPTVTESKPYIKIKFRCLTFQIFYTLHFHLCS